MKVKPRFDRWHSSESTRLPPMWPTFKSQRQSHNYVGSVCWFSPLLREIFLQVPPFSPFLKNQHFQIAIRSGIIQTKNHWVDLLPGNSLARQQNPLAPGCRTVLSLHAVPLNPNRKSFINYLRSSYEKKEHLSPLSASM